MLSLQVEVTILPTDFVTVPSDLKKISLVIFIFVLFFIFTFFSNKNNCSNKLAHKYSIDNKNYCLLTAVSESERQQGLMYFKKPVDFDGMIFIFPDKQTRNFWNKNTYMDLDIIWMDGERVVGKSYLPSIVKTKNPLTVSSPKEVNKVVEIVK